MATLGEIMRDPSKASKEDVENFDEIVKILEDFKEKAKPYGYKKNENKVEKI